MRTVTWEGFAEATILHDNAATARGPILCRKPCTGPGLWAEDVPEADAVALYQAMWAAERGGPMRAEINCSDVRMRLADRFPEFAASLNRAVARCGGAAG